MDRVRKIIISFNTGLIAVFFLFSLSLAQTVAPDSTMIEIDESVVEISVERLPDGEFKFYPFTENIEIVQIEWDFGDGHHSRLRSPTHSYNVKTIPRTVHLRINNNDALSATRVVYPFIRYEFGRAIDSNIEATSIEMYAGSFVPESYKEHIRRLSEMPSFHNLQSYLIWLSREEIITTFGSRGDMRSANWAYVLLADPQSGRIDTILGPVLNRYRYDLVAADKVKYLDSEWPDHFRGLRPIWIQFK